MKTHSSSQTQISKATGRSPRFAKTAATAKKTTHAHHNGTRWLIEEHRADADEIDLVENVKAFIGKTLEERAASPAQQRAWDKFYRVYTGVVRRFVIGQGIRGLDVDDCVQDVWHYVLKKLVDFEFRGVHSGFRSWLYRIVSSVTIDLCRIQTRRREISMDDDRHDATNSATDSPRNGGGEHEWRRSMIATLLNEIRGRTSRTNYRIIEMRFIEGKSVADTGEAVGMTPRQVWYRQHRVLKKLRALAEIYTGGMFHPVESVDAP